MIDWNSSTWGQSGANVHESETGSWVRGSHGEELPRSGRNSSALAVSVFETATGEEQER